MHRGGEGTPGWQTQQAGLDSLDIDALNCILLHLAPCDLGRLACVCTRLHTVLKAEAIWRAAAERAYAADTLCVDERIDPYRASRMSLGGPRPYPSFHALCADRNMGFACPTLDYGALRAASTWRYNGTDAWGPLPGWQLYYEAQVLAVQVRPLQWDKRGGRTRIVSGEVRLRIDAMGEVDLRLAGGCLTIQPAGVPAASYRRAAAFSTCLQPCRPFEPTRDIAKRMRGAGVGSAPQPARYAGVLAYDLVMAEKAFAAALRYWEDGPGATAPADEPRRVELLFCYANEAPWPPIHGGLFGADYTGAHLVSLSVERTTFAAAFQEAVGGCRCAPLRAHDQFETEVQAAARWAHAPPQEFPTLSDSWRAFRNARDRTHVAHGRAVPALLPALLPALPAPIQIQ